MKLGVGNKGKYKFTNTESYQKNFNFQNYYDRLLQTLTDDINLKVAAFHTQFDGYKVVKKQKTVTLFLSFEYYFSLREKY